MTRMLSKSKKPNILVSRSWLCRGFATDIADEIATAPPVQRSEKCMNQVTLLGRCGRDAELRGNEQYPVVVFNLATNKYFVRSNGVGENRTDWHRISVFNKGLLDKIAINIRQGDRVMVSGAIQHDEYTDSKGENRRSTVIVAQDIINITKRYLAEQRTDGEAMEESF